MIKLLTWKIIFCLNFDLVAPVGISLRCGDLWDDLYQKSCFKLVNEGCNIICKCLELNFRITPVVVETACKCDSFMGKRKQK